MLKVSKLSILIRKVCSVLQLKAVRNVLYLYLHNDEAAASTTGRKAVYSCPSTLMYLCMNDMLSEREASRKCLLFNIVNFGLNLADLFHEMESYVQRIFIFLFYLIVYRRIYLINNKYNKGIDMDRRRFNLNRLTIHSAII